MSRKSTRRGGTFGNRAVKSTAKSAQKGAQDGVNQSAYWIAFGVAASAVYALWAGLKRLAGRNDRLP